MQERRQAKRLERSDESLPVVCLSCSTKGEFEGYNRLDATMLKVMPADELKKPGKKFSRAGAFQSSWGSRPRGQGQVRALLYADVRVRKKKLDTRWFFDKGVPKSQASFSRSTHQGGAYRRERNPTRASSRSAPLSFGSSFTSSSKKTEAIPETMDSPDQGAKGLCWMK